MHEALYFHPTGPCLSLAVTALQRIPERIVEKAVVGMLPKGRLGRSLFNHLKVFKGPSHPHQAQQPTDITKIINAQPGALATVK